MQEKEHRELAEKEKKTTERVPLYAVSQVRYGTERTYDVQETHRCGTLASDGPLKRR
jgi:hypothetical protein